MANISNPSIISNLLDFIGKYTCHGVIIIKAQVSVASQSQPPIAPVERIGEIALQYEEWYRFKDGSLYFIFLPKNTEKG